MTQIDLESLSNEIERLRESLLNKDKEIESMRMSNLFLSTLFDGISEEIIVLDPDFNVTDVNRAFLRRYGLNKFDALGRKCYEIKRRVSAPCNFEATSCPLSLASKTGERVEMTLFHEDSRGEKKELALYMYPLKVRGEKTKYFMEIARDVTENRALMRKLQASEKRFRAILDTATDAVISIDQDHGIILFNNAAQRIFGYSRQEVLGKKIHLLIPEKDRDPPGGGSQLLGRSLSGIVGKTLSLNGIRKGGEEFPIELSLSFLELDGEVTHTAIIRDVSDQKQLEKKLLQSERLAAVGQAAARVTHELKNPLMIIGGLSAQIKKSLVHDKNLQKVEMILEEVRRLEKLVANLGDFTKEYKLVKRPADINFVLRDVIRIMAGAYSPEKYHFDAFLSAEPAQINCDPDKLRQVFMNIISNGLEAMPRGGSIRIMTQRSPNGIEIKISDEGIGISEEDLQRIFEPFYTTRTKGSGLGLSISYKIVEAHNGEISAISSPLKGTTFIVRLPSG